MTGVVGRDREGLKEVVVDRRGRDTDEGMERLVRRDEIGVFVDGAGFVDVVSGAGARVAFLAEWNWRSRASRRDSTVLPEREEDGVCGGPDRGGAAAARGGVARAVDSPRVPNLGRGSVGAGRGVWRGALRD